MERRLVAFICLAIAVTLVLAMLAMESPAGRVNVTFSNLSHSTWAELRCGFGSERMWGIHILGRATNHGKGEGWVTVVGYLEWNGTRHESEKRVHFEPGSSTMVIETFACMRGDVPLREDFGYGFEAEQA